MKRTSLLVVALVCACTLAACGSDDGGSSTAPTPSGSQELAGTQWDLVTYADASGNATDVPAGISANANFTEKQVSGSTGCNTYAGPYETTESGSITFGALATTLVACPGDRGTVETAYVKALEQAKKYVVGDGTLLISNGTGGTLLTYTKTTKVPLVGTEWRATSINNGNQGVETAVEGIDVSLRMIDGGTASGSGGCNSFTTTFTTKGSALSFGAIASTKKSCNDQINAQETAYFNALGKATKYTLRGDSLELRDATGALQVAYTAKS